MEKRKTYKRHLLELKDMLSEYERRENEFPVKGDLSEIPEGFRGLALIINDHGNVTLYMCYKNGNVRELASIV